LIVEGNPGFVVINPPEEVIQEYRRNQEKIGAHRENLEELITSPAETLLEIKKISRLVTKEQASLLANKALGMDSSQEIEQLLEASYPFNHQ